MSARLGLKGVPIAFVTAAVAKSEDESKVVQIGAFPFVAKPLVLTEVLACLKHQPGVAGAARPIGNS